MITSRQTAILNLARGQSAAEMYRDKEVSELQGLLTLFQMLAGPSDLRLMQEILLRWDFERAPNSDNTLPDAMLCEIGVVEAA